MSLAGSLPAYLNLPPHLSAHKYFFVCTLTVAAWDTLVLSPRTWKLMKTKGWPPLKVLFSFVRLFMPIEFTIVAVAFFDIRFTRAQCDSFYLFEPICTAILLAATSAIHVIRIRAIYANINDKNRTPENKDNNRALDIGLGLLFAAQVVVTGVSCAFYRSVPLDVGQGCIAGPKHNWVGIYWLAPTLLYTVTFALALNRSLKSLQEKALTPWKLMLRDGLNLYGAIWLVNMVNMLFWFIVKPTGIADPIKTTVTSMAAVLTASMSLRIVLSIRGDLAYGGSFGSTAQTSRSISTRSGIPTNLSSQNPHTYTLDDMRSKPEPEWVDGDGRSSLKETRSDVLPIDRAGLEDVAVKVTVDREVEYDGTPFSRAVKHI